MVGERPLFDTNILIDFIAGLPQAKKELGRYSSRSISITTWIEVLTGVSPNQESMARAFLKSFTVYLTTEAISEQAVLVRRRLRIKLPDAIILATAEVEDLLLVTRNTRDFPESMSGVRIPYKI